MAVSTIAAALIGAQFQPDIIAITPAHLATVFQAFIHVGSQTHNVSLQDLNVVSSAGQGNHANDTWATTYDRGTPFIDALIYLGLPVADRARCNVQAAAIGAGPLANVIDVIRALFFQYVMIIARGRVSSSPTNIQGTDVPRLLQTVYNLNDTPIQYMQRICGFDMANLNPEWARHVNTGGLGREIVTRFGLGVAGYRWPRAILALGPPDVVPQPPYAAAALAVVMSIATQPFNWEVHSATRDNNITTTYGPLNNNIMNLYLDCYTAGVLQAAVAARVIPVMPIRSASHIQYRTWALLYTSPIATRMF